ncbi:hypothetical protein, partial [Asanoa sp. NPDC050611]|uniref:hypothetical protein n=1 Tax=Asanoa sp. NPDC050611 TaxID=3157098 RepID=UPI0033D3950B
MSRFARVSTWMVALAWTVFYAAANAFAHRLPDLATAVVQLAVPPLLWVALLQIGSTVLTARPALRLWLSAVDPPARLLAATVALLPARRRDWGRAMLAELAEVRGRSARWRFALSAGWATLLLPPRVGYPFLTLLTATSAAVTAAIGAAVGRAMPELTVFTTTFAGVLAALMVLGVARGHRPHLPAPVPTMLVTGGVVAATVATVVFLRREPDAHLAPPSAAYLAATLAVCLCLAAAAPRWLGTDRLAPHLGVTSGLAFTAWSLLTIRLDGMEPPMPFVFLLGAVLVGTPFALFMAPAFATARRAGSALPGVQATVWTLIAMIPFTYALWLPETLRRHATDGRTLDGELIAPPGSGLGDAIVFCLGFLDVTNRDGVQTARTGLSKFG